jgi:hypothetical protein
MGIIFDYSFGNPNLLCQISIYPFNGKILEAVEKKVGKLV